MAKATTRMLLAVATPMHMMDPISAGTLSVVRVRNRNTHDSGQRGGKRRDDDERVQPGLKIHHDQQVHQHNRETQAGQQADIRRAHGVELPAHGDEAAARKRAPVRVDDSRDVAARAAQIAILHRSVNIHHAADVVVIQHRHFIRAGDGRNVRQDLRPSRRLRR